MKFSGQIEWVKNLRLFENFSENVYEGPIGKAREVTFISEK